MYGICTALMFVLIAHAFHFGDPDRIIYGTDYNGNLCGRGTPPLSITQAQWTTRTLLWYPITFNSATGHFELTSAINFGVCVESCPTSGTLVPTYGGSASPSLPASFIALFSSEVTMHRCLPAFSTYNCGANDQCASSRASMRSSLLAEIGAGDLFYGAVAQLHRMWGMLVTLSILAIILCYAWLFFLRRLVKPLMTLTAVGFLVCLVAVGVVAAKERSSVAAGSAQDWYTAVAVLALAAAVLYACALLYFFKDLLLSCDIIELSSRVIVDVPSVAVVPVVAALLVFVCSLFAFFIAVMIYSSSSLEQQQQLLPSTNASSTSVSMVIIPEKWRTIGQLYNIFMFLWTMGLIHAVAYLTVAFVGVQWYWSTPGAEKTLPPSPVAWAVRTTIIFHLGTLLTGSLLIALVQLARLLLRFLEHRLKRLAADQSAVRCLICCAECLLACFERIVKFLTKNAYIMTAMTGDSLVAGAQHATSLLLRNANVLFVDIIGEVIMACGKALITAFTVLVGYAWMRGLAGSEQGTASEEVKSNFVVVLALLALVVYFITCVFGSVFSVCIDTVLLCFCVDKTENNGLDRPHYFPAELESRLNAAASRSRKKDGAESDPLLNGGKNQA
jgi:hypothetical protein